MNALPISDSYLERIELYGFRSFADRTCLDPGQTTLLVGYPDPGVIDLLLAVAWVLSPAWDWPEADRNIPFPGRPERPRTMRWAEVTAICVTADGVSRAITRRCGMTPTLFLDGQVCRSVEISRVLSGWRPTLAADRTIALAYQDYRPPVAIADIPVQAPAMGQWLIGACEPVPWRPDVSYRFARSAEHQPDLSRASHW